MPLAMVIPGFKVHEKTVVTREDQMTIRTGKEAAMLDQELRDEKLQRSQGCRVKGQPRESRVPKICESLGTVWVIAEKVEPTRVVTTSNPGNCCPS